MQLQIPDVNVLIYAFTDESPRHQAAADWLDAALATHSLGISELVLSTVVRVMTHERVTWAGYEPADVIAQCEALRAAQGVTLVQAGPRHWSIFSALVNLTHARGNLVPDCYLAALAIEHGATWASGDTFFGRIPGLDWVNPFA